jgi:PAS domain S-box-containing protein
MTDIKSSSDKAADLRMRAEEAVDGKPDSVPENLEALSPDEIQQMLHELRVHQIELEMQNEELRRTQVELETARERYFSLYDLAPVGYVTISEQGLILETNLTAATLLGIARGALVNRPVSRFILKEDQDIYYRHRQQLFKTGMPQECELRMVKQESQAVWVHLSATLAQDGDAAAPVCCVVLIDITARKGGEQQIASQLSELMRWQDVMLNREGRVQELKREVNQFCRRDGESIRYPSQEAGQVDSGEANL